MSKLLKVSRRLSFAAAASAIFAAAVPAQAAVIASFDPPFGPAFPTLGFKGTTTFDVTPGCYALGGGFQSTGGACQITALAAQVNFYNVTDSNTILNSVSLTATDFSSGYVFGFYKDPFNGQITGFNTFDSNLFAVSVPSLLISTTMVLYFQASTNIMSFVSTSATVAGVGGAFLRNCTNTSEGCASDAFNTSNRGTLTVTTVPEPDSVALALLGLGALALTRHRKTLPR